MLTILPPVATAVISWFLNDFIRSKQNKRNRDIEEIRGIIDIFRTANTELKDEVESLRNEVISLQKEVHQLRDENHKLTAEIRKHEKL